MFEFDELVELQQNMQNLSKALPSETKRFLMSQGNKLRAKTLSRAKGLVNEKTGNYFESIKRGKVYHYGTGKVLSIRVYSNAPHAHLIEDGYDKMGGGSVNGKQVFEKANKEFVQEYHNNCVKFVDRMVKKL